jgi:hypothetical protein
LVFALELTIQRWFRRISRALEAVERRKRQLEKELEDLEDQVARDSPTYGGHGFGALDDREPRDTGDGSPPKTS